MAHPTTCTEAESEEPMHKKPAAHSGGSIGTGGAAKSTTPEQSQGAVEVLEEVSALQEADGDTGIDLLEASDKGEVAAGSLTLVGAAADQPIYLGCHVIFKGLANLPALNEQEGLHNTTLKSLCGRRLAGVTGRSRGAQVRKVANRNVHQ